MYHKSPYVYFGSKRLIVSEIWKRLGKCNTYLEPFLGSASILLARPSAHIPNTKEIVNDKNGFISNFWRAVQCDPERVARYAYWPSNENDLHARDLWLANRLDELQSRLEGDPDYFDAKIAGWWVWCMALKIGGLAGEMIGPWISVNGRFVKRANADQVGVKRSIQNLKSYDGIKRDLSEYSKATKGVDKTIQNIDHATGIKRGLSAYGDKSISTELERLINYFYALQKRLQGVIVTSGDWKRIVTDISIGNNSKNKPPIGIVLDPPYDKQGRDTVYTHDHEDIAAIVREWAIQHGDNPNLRIAYCGYEDDSNSYQWPEGWTRLAWKANGGYGLQRKNGTNLNRLKEVIYFSSGCGNQHMVENVKLF